MPNTKSAERRMRNSAKKQLNNQSWRSRLKTVEKNYLSVLSTGKPEEAAAALRNANSALDKAAKRGVIHASTASRKKSRLAVGLNRLKAAPVAGVKAS